MSILRGFAVAVKSECLLGNWQLRSFNVENYDGVFSRDSLRDIEAALPEEPRKCYQYFDKDADSSGDWVKPERSQRDRTTSTSSVDAAVANNSLYAEISQYVSCSKDSRPATVNCKKFDDCAKVLLS